jgi:PAS domain S-box-containing protein
MNLPAPAAYGIYIFLSAAVTSLGAAVYIKSLRKRQGVGSGTSVNQLKSALHDEKMKSSIIVNAIDDGVMLIDNSGMIQSFNAGASKLTGWAEAEAMNLDYRLVMEIVDSKGQPYAENTNPFHRVFVEGVTVRDNNASLLTKSKQILSLNISVSPLLDDQKRVFAAVAVFRDVTKERAEETQRAEFISTASHEMRTPVAAIEGYLSLAMNSNVSTVDSRARDYLEKAHSSTQHLGKLFQDLLTSAKAEDGRLTSHPVVIEMGEYLQRLTEDLKFTAAKKNLAIEFLVGGDTFIDASSDNGKVVKPLYYAVADPDRLREVVTNIFDNAVKYTEQGKVSIGLTGNNQVVQFYVKDTGPGIPAEDIPHLFQKFYRVDNSATRTIGGTGLGLFISRKIVELYHGRIWAESEIDHGTTFYINLPRLSTSQAQHMQNEEASKQALPTITSLAGTSTTT